MNNWQSTRSTMPPWPGIQPAKSLILVALLSALARKPPNGAKIEAYSAITTPWYLILL